MNNNFDLRICIVAENKPGYSETFIRSHIEHLSDTTIFLYGRNFPCYDNSDYLIISKVFNLAERLYYKIAIKILNISLNDVKIKAFKKYIKKHKIEAVLAEYGQAGVNIYQACHDLKIPLIVHFHGFDAYNQYILTKKGKEYPELFKNAAAIIAVSRDMQQQLIRLGASEKKVEYNPYGVDLNLFQVTQPEQNPPTFVSIGRFADKKAPHLSIIAFQEVVDLVPKAKLKMIGDGSLLESCRCLVQSLNLAEQVEFLGSCPHKEVAKAMQGARAFVQHSVKTSYGDCEGTPNAVLEAGACGLPVIATRHAGIKDVVIENETGLLVEEKDVKAMSEHMLTLAKNPELASQMGKAARERIQKNFTIEKSIQQLQNIIHNCCERQ